MKSYSFEIVIEREKGSRGYLAYSPALPGCFGSGKTIETTRASMRAAVEQHVQSLIAHGERVPQPRHRVRVEELTVGVP